MRLPHHLTDSPFFVFLDEKDFRLAISTIIDEVELGRINRLLESGHIPVTSKEVVATIFGINAGIVWSFINKSHRYYRKFYIPKGSLKREIIAPKIGLKIIQKWISVQLQRRLNVADHVYGFVPGRSHLDAAARHAESKWIYSVDIENFFPSTTKEWVKDSLINFGYDYDSANLIVDLCCYRGVLVQGAPSSPVLSNLSMVSVDRKINDLAVELGLTVTRYADDITFSSKRKFPETLPGKITDLLKETPWKISEKKTHFALEPGRLKVHGFLVNGKSIRLTKGYRNKLRAYSHVLKSGKYSPDDFARLSGHVNFQNQVNNYVS